MIMLIQMWLQGRLSYELQTKQGKSYGESICTYLLQIKHAPNYKHVNI